MLRTPQSPFQTSETSSPGYYFLCSHFQWTQLFLTDPLSPVRARRTPCTFPILHPAHGSSPTMKGAQGLGLTSSSPVLLFITVIRSLVLTYLMILVFIPPPFPPPASFPPLPPSTILIIDVIY